ncbi:MAG: TFIIB-type zinc ribbon-containing protein [Mycoplasmatota bacterium]
MQPDVNLTQEEKETFTIIKTDEGEENGQDKCPKCGATDISANPKTGKLRCNFCRCEFEPEKVESTDISELSGINLGSGTQDIAADSESMVTLKCESCGAEVVIDTNEAMQSRCHWCRNTLSLNSQIPNGSVPDMVLPFSLPKDDARTIIEKFVKARSFYAHPAFKAEFTTENIMGVYFPYMIVDVNAHSTLKGEGEHQTRRYSVKRGDHSTTYYDANVYHVERDFDVMIDDLTIESNSDKLNKTSEEKTTNIINAIMPFDTENAVKWNANYLKGYSSEKRDVNVEGLSDILCEQSKDVARFSANKTLNHYDRGVKWDYENLEIKGQRWHAIYLPVWLYSYQEVKGTKKLLHYVSVNARTKEVMGSVPIYQSKLIACSILVEICAFFAMFFVDFDYSFLFLIAGFVYYFAIYNKYRNKEARHLHETETKNTVTNMQNVDNYIRERKRMSNSMMIGANNKSVKGDKVGLKVIKKD